MTRYRRGGGLSGRGHGELGASTSQRKTLSLPGPAGSSSCTRSPRRTAGMRRCAPTWPRACPPTEAAARFGYTPASLLSAVRDFRAGARDFFVSGRPGPKTAPGKDAARPRIIELRAAGHSIDEIATALAAEGTPLNRTGIAEVIAEQGLPRMWRRPDAERGGPAREIQARAEALDFTALPGAGRDPAGRAVPGHPRPGRARRPGHGGRGGLPVHRQDPRPVLRAVAAGAQADQHPAGLPRLRHRRRPRRRPVRRAHRPAEGHRADHLLLPAASIPGRPRS